MGSYLSVAWNRLFPKEEYKIVIVGLDNAGKTTTLYKMFVRLFVNRPGWVYIATEC